MHFNQSLSLQLVPNAHAEIARCRGVGCACEDVLAGVAKEIEPALLKPPHGGSDAHLGPQGNLGRGHNVADLRDALVYPLFPGVELPILSRLLSVWYHGYSAGELDAVCGCVSRSDLHEQGIPARCHTGLFASPPSLVYGAQVKVVVRKCGRHEVRLVEADGSSGFLQLAFRVEQGRGPTNAQRDVNRQGFHWLVPNAQQTWAHLLASASAGIAECPHDIEFHVVEGVLQLPGTEIRTGAFHCLPDGGVALVVIDGGPTVAIEAEHPFDGEALTCCFIGVKIPVEPALLGI